MTYVIIKRHYESEPLIKICAKNILIILAGVFVYYNVFTLGVLTYNKIIIVIFLSISPRISHL